MEQDVPLIAPQKAVGLALVFKPFVAQQNADGFSRNGAEPVEDNAGLAFAKMFKRDFQRVVRRRGEFGLEAKAKAARLGAGFFEAQIFLEQPDEVGGEIVFGQRLFPGVKGFGQLGPVELGC
jgi:hypothetical protein